MVTFINKNVKMGQIFPFNPAYLYITITYITRMIMQFLRLKGTCRMIAVLQNYLIVLGREITIFGKTI